MHVEKIIQQAWLDRKPVTVKIKQKIWKQASTSYAFTCEPSCVRVVQNKGCGQCAFPSRITVPIQKQVIYLQGFGTTWQTVPSQKWSIEKPQKCHIPYTWNYWRVEYLVIHSKNAVGEIFIWRFDHCMDRNPCLQPKWRTFNLAISRNLPNRQIKATAKYITYTVLYIVSYSYGTSVSIHRIQTCMYITMPNRNYTTVCMLSPCNKVICWLSFREHCTIISAPCIAADTCRLLYHNSPIKVLPHQLPCTRRTWGIVGNLIFLKGDFLTVG